MLGALDNAVDAMFHRGVPDTCPEGEGRQDHLRALALAAIINRDPRTATDSPTSESGDSGVSVATDASAESGTSGPADEGMDRWAPNGDVVHVGDRTDMLVVIDLQTLLTGLHQRSLIDNGHDIELPIESYRRMACTAGIIPIVLNGDGVVLDEGRRQRLATRNQRRALRAMYQTCAIPGCRVRTQHCEPDHIWTWEHHGPSNLNNLVHP